MEETLKVLNAMVEDGVIENYAIGGAVAAIYYLEPFDTSDVDIFVQLKAFANELIMLAPIYDYLRRRGYNSEGEFIRIEGFPVQFLPVFNRLTDEAVGEALTIKFARTQTRVMRAEHLVAIMLDTGRTKDYLRIGMFLEQDLVDMNSLSDVLRRHGLSEKWKANQYRFKP